VRNSEVVVTLALKDGPIHTFGYRGATLTFERKRDGG
jgi:hypothetical protein